METNTCVVVELDAREMRLVCGGGRFWRPVGFTQTGEPIYAWVEE